MNEVLLSFGCPDRVPQEIMFLVNIHAMNILPNFDTMLKSEASFRAIIDYDNERTDELTDRLRTTDDHNGTLGALVLRLMNVKL